MISVDPTLCTQIRVYVSFSYSPCLHVLLLGSAGRLLCKTLLLIKLQGHIATPSHRWMARLCVQYAFLRHNCLISLHVSHVCVLFLKTPHILYSFLYPISWLFEVERYIFILSLLKEVACKLLALNYLLQRRRYLPLVSSRRRYCCRSRPFLPLRFKTKR